MQRLYNKSFSDSGWTSFDSTAQSDLVFYGLGNTRVTFKDATSCSASDHQFDVVSMHDYYPFGKVLRAFTQESERYLTTQHPRDAETDWDYRGARFYDSDIGRFLGVDPLAEKYPLLSPFAYVANSPLFFVDPDGREIIPSSRFLSNERLASTYNWLKSNSIAWDMQMKEWMGTEKNYELDFFLQEVFEERPSMIAGTWRTVGIDGKTTFNPNLFDGSSKELSDAGIMMVFFHEPGHLKKGQTDKAGYHGGTVWEMQVYHIFSGLNEANDKLGWGLSFDQMMDLAHVGMNLSAEGRTLIPNHLATHIIKRSGLEKGTLISSPEFQEAYQQFINDTNELLYKK